MASARVASETAMSASARRNTRSANALSAATFAGECISGMVRQVRSCTVAVSRTDRGGYLSLDAWNTSGRGPAHRARPTGIRLSANIRPSRVTVVKRSAPELS